MKGKNKMFIIVRMFAMCGTFESKPLKGDKGKIIMFNSEEDAHKYAKSNSIDIYVVKKGG